MNSSHSDDDGDEEEEGEPGREGEGREGSINTKRRKVRQRRTTTTVIWRHSPWARDFTECLILFALSHLLLTRHHRAGSLLMTPLRHFPSDSQRSQHTWPRSHSQYVAKLKLEPKCPEP